MSADEVRENEGILLIRREDLTVEELDGEAVIYDPICGAVHRFNDVVLFVWSGCDGTRTLADLIDDMTKRYRIDADEAEQQVKRVIAEFRRLGLLRDDLADLSEGVEPSIQPREVTDEQGGNSRSLSRRQLIRGGVGMLVFVPPVISTFFASGAHAAYSPNPINPNFSPLGAGSCKNPGYSCAANNECCGFGLSNTQCESGTCCVKNNKVTCIQDSDCCSGLSCGGGTCT